MRAMVVEIGPEIEQLVFQICRRPEQRVIQVLAPKGADEPFHEWMRQENVGDGLDFRRLQYGCATWKGQSWPAGLPIVVEFAAVTAATDGDDRIGAANGPEHSGAFEPGGDEGFATRFDHP